MRQVPLAELVLDFAFYPRTKIDNHHVNAIADAIKAGTTMPPIIIDKDSKRVSDGFHRVRATARAKGAGASIAVVEKDYPTDQDMLLDAIRMNATHGRNLSPFDRAHAVILCEKLEIDEDAIIGALQTTASTLDRLRTTKVARTGRVRVALKQTIRHKAGERLTPDQAEANRRLGGMNQLFYVNQLILLLENDLVDPDNEHVAEALTRLAALLEKHVAALAAS